MQAIGEVLGDARGGERGVAIHPLPRRPDPPLQDDAFPPSPERIQREIAPVLSKQLSPELESWAREYEKVGRRNTYLWKWARQGVEVTMLPCVDPARRDELCDTKVLGVMLDVLLDDVADHMGDGELLERLLLLPFAYVPLDFSGFSPEKQAYAAFTCRLWQEIIGRARRYPVYEEHAELLRYDYLQLFNVMRYSQLLNKNLALLNLVEHDLYLPHNMHMMVSSTLDLMCSPAFDRREIGRVREVVWNAQCMGRIGNLTTTWQREVGEEDFTSGVFARALAHNDVTIEQLLAGDRAEIEAGVRRGAHEEYFLRRWQEHRCFLISRRPAIRSFDVLDLVAGLERLICLHLGSRGYK